MRGQLLQVPGVSNATARYREGRAYVVCARSVPDSALVNAVARAGPGFSAWVARR